MDIKPPITIRDWSTKVSAMPNIPRGKNGYPYTLKVILHELKNFTPLNTIINIEGSESQNTLEQLLIHLRPSGIVRKSSTNWSLSTEANYWLETQDNNYLFTFLCANVKFFSELLALLKKSPKKIQEIKEVASNGYKLSWKTKSELHSRLNWLRDLNLVVFQDFSQCYSITDSGLVLINDAPIVNIDEIKEKNDSTLEETELIFSSWVNIESISIEKTNTSRKNGIGYIPGSMQVALTTISEYLFMMTEITELENIIKYSKTTYGISSTSTKHFLSTIEYLNLIERISRTQFQITQLGKTFLEHGSQLDFAYLIHKGYAFIFEILFELKDKNLTTKELSVIAKVSYNFPSEESYTIGKRITILKNAELIQESGVHAYKLTHRGELLLKKFNELDIKFSLSEDEGEKSKSVSDENTGIDSLLNEIRLASKDSTNPRRFEEAVSTAFELLGFKSELLGYSGNTDILIQSPTSPKFMYKVAVDTKSTYSGPVTENQINFDTIKEHRKKHNANFSLIVGREFVSKRLIERSIKHSVALLNIEQLEILIKLHQQIPLKSDTYKKLFSQNGLININVINEDRLRIEREGKIMQSIVHHLTDESEDSITEGIIQPRELYLLLKYSNIITPAATIEEIKQILEFLASPLIDCVRYTKDGYYAVSSLEDAIRKFEFFISAFKN